MSGHSRLVLQGTDLKPNILKHMLQDACCSLRGDLCGLMTSTRFAMVVVVEIDLDLPFMLQLSLYDLVYCIQSAERSTQLDMVVVVAEIFEHIVPILKPGCGGQGHEQVGFSEAGTQLRIHGKSSIQHDFICLSVACLGMDGHGEASHG